MQYISISSRIANEVTPFILSRLKNIINFIALLWAGTIIRENFNIFADPSEADIIINYILYIEYLYTASLRKGA